MAIGGVVSGGAIRTEVVSAEGAREVPSGLEPVSLRAGGADGP
ncbi:hypothetical protein [Streptomyces coffeae]|nr:hypothetical protein [Streptomyces coffeae]